MALAGIGPSVVGTELEMRITAFGTFVSDRVMTALDLDFGQPVAIESLSLVDAAGELVPFYFVAHSGSRYTGRLYWMWDRGPPFQGIRYTLRMSAGDWSSGTTGCSDMAAMVAARSLLVPNYIFSEIADGVPVDWRLTGEAQVVDEGAFRGNNCILLIGHHSEEDGSQTSGIQSAAIQLNPSTEYRLRVHMKVTQQRDSGARHQGIMAQVGYFRDDGSRVSRSFQFYPRVNTANTEYLGQWTVLDVTTNSPATFDYARVEVSTMGGFDGQCLIDYIILEEFDESHPLRFEVIPPRP